MHVIQGIPVSPGVVIARAFVLGDDRVWVPRRSLTPEAVEAEQARFDRALADAVADLDRVHAEAEREMGSEAAKVFLFHKGMLRDRSLIDPIRAKIASERVNAEHAVTTVFDDLAAQFRRKTDSAFTTKADDIRDLANRLLTCLVGQRRSRLDEITEPTVVIARDLTLSQTASFNRRTVVGFATDAGGRTSHTAIVANGLGLPAVVGCHNVTSLASDGERVVLDGDRGVVILDPDNEQLGKYAGYAEQHRLAELSLAELADQPAVTRDGTPVELLGNIEFPEEVSAVLSHGGTGVGLYRTEFLFLAANREPSEEDHFEAYRTAIGLLDGRPLTIRTIDLGADKYTQARAAVPERNPALGLRSIRYCLAERAIFKRQLRAILRASALGPVKIMFPLITSIGELRHARLILRDVMEDLAEEGMAFDRSVPVGMMVELPSAALQAGIFAREVDFFSIGTNDLVQYTLAVDRTNERVAGLYQPWHPAVVMLIRQVARAARKAGIPVSCCGEAAGEQAYAMLLLGLGLRTLSVTSGAIPQVKRLVRSVTMQECERVARKALTFDSDVEVSAYVREHVRKIVPEASGGRSAGGG